MNDAPTQRSGEDERLKVLQTYPLDKPGLSTQLDRLASVAAQLCGAPIGLVSIVSDDHQFFIGKSGLDAAGTPREYSFCAHAMLKPEIMVVSDARQDSRFSDNPLVTGDMSIRFYAGVPMISREGQPLGSFCIIDTVPRLGLTVAQREGLEGIASAAMAMIEAARSEASSAAAEKSHRAAIRDQELRYQHLADAMPQLLWSTRPNGLTDYFNQVWIDYTGEPAEASYGSGWLDFLHPDDRAPTGECWREAVESRKTYEIEYRLRNAEGEYRWMLARGVPMLDDRGEVTRWFGSCTDIDESKRSSELLEILSRELNHRIKNIFAVIGGLVSLTIRHRPEVAEAGRELQERILALGRAHDHVRASGTRFDSTEAQSSLIAMLKLIVSPYQAGSRNRVTISGSDIAIDDRSATPLALFVHELGTNAAKYGALSTQDGSVEIELSRDNGDCLIRWSEQGGPPVNRPGDDGFGASLVELSIARQLGGVVEYEWRTEGLVVLARIPSSAMMR
ncbi:MAG: PAS domain-containing protein [Novosphingobium sp.]|nr:PAS domain-containing protein [Novosphingobium sp.]